MIPINILSKSVRNRSQFALVTKTFVTSRALWKENQRGPKDGEGSPGGGKQQSQSCGPRDGGSKQSGENAKKQMKSSCGPLDENEYLEKKKQGGGSSCGPNTSPKEKQDKCQTKPSAGDSKSGGKCGQNQNPSECSCPPYSTPKLSEGKDSKKCSPCPETSKCESEKRKTDPCGDKGKDDKCGAQKRNDPCKRNSCQDDSREDNKCAGEDTKKRGNYCGPVAASSQGACGGEKDKSQCGDPCGSAKAEDKCSQVCEESDPCERTKSRGNCAERENECDARSDPCPTSTASCSDECGEKFKLDPCKAQKNDCSEDRCPQENDCGRDPCKKVEIPKLASCCEVSAAKECICKLKELQVHWEQVIAVQESLEKDRKGPQECPKTDCQGQGQAKKADKRSNMIYVVLSAIMAAVVYYTYNGDFEPETLFVEDEEVNDNNNNNNSEEDD